MNLYTCCKKNSHLLLHSCRHLLSSVILFGVRQNFGVSTASINNKIFLFEKSRLNHSLIWSAMARCLIFTAPVLMIPFLRWMRFAIHFPILGVGLGFLKRSSMISLAIPAALPVMACRRFLLQLQHHSPCLTVAFEWQKKGVKCSRAGQTSSKSSVASNNCFANYF